MDEYIAKGRMIYSDLIESNAYKVCREVGNILQKIKVLFDIDTEQYFDIKVILSELLQNAIKHGNECDINKKIHVDVWLQENSKTLGITVSDQGCGFNTVSMRMKENDIFRNPFDESGRGLFIVENLCDYVEFNSSGNSVTVKKRLL